MSKSKGRSRYDTSPGIEGRYQPGSHARVLANLPGITSKSAMDRAEYEALLAAQEKYVKVITDEDVFTAKLICGMHREWLRHLYEWAGRYRTVEMSKGGFHWPPAYLVGQNMATLETETLGKFTPCRPGNYEQIAAAMAQVQAELLLVHPFREGNGRMARWVTDLMAMQAGLPALNYGFTGKSSAQRRTRYLAAVIAGYRGEYEPLTRFLLEALSRALPGFSVSPRAPSNKLDSRTLRRSIARRKRGSAK